MCMSSCYAYLKLPDVQSWRNASRNCTLANDVFPKTYILTNYVLQDNVCIYMLHVDILYTYTYIFIHEYLKLLDVQSWRHAWCHCTSASQTMFFWRLFEGFRPSWTQQKTLITTSFHEQTNTLTCPQFEHMWLGFNHRTNSGIGHGETILTGQSKSIAWANIKINEMSETNTCIWTQYVLQDTVCIYMMLYYIVYIYTYIYIFIHEYLKLLDVQSWHHAWCLCTSAIHTMFLAGFLRGSGPLERSTSLLSQQVFMHQQRKALTCPQFEHMWLGFNHRLNSGIGHGKNILTGHSKSHQQKDVVPKTYMYLN